MDSTKRNELIQKICMTMVELRTGDVRAEHEIYKSMNYELENRLPAGKIKMAVYQPSSLAIVDTSELYLIASSLRNYCDRNSKRKFDVDLMEYFTLEEISIAKLLRKSNEESTLIKMNALFKGDENNPEWIGVMSYAEIVDASNRGLLKYNMATQRVAKVFINNGKLHYIPDIDESTVESIAQAVESGEFESNTVTLNILRTDDEPFINAGEGCLIIDAKDNEVDIIDGMHRIKGIVRAWQIRQKKILDGKATKQIEGYMAVCVKNISEEQAKTFIYQESLANTQQKSTQMLYSPDSLLTQFLVKLNRARGSEKKNPYYGRISSYVNDSSDDIISTAFVASLMNDMTVVSTFNKMITNESKMMEAVDEMVTFARIVNEKLDGKVDANILKGQCFMAGTIVKYVSLLSNGLSIDTKKIDEYVDVVSKNVTNLNFDYPLMKKQLRVIKSIYK